MGYVVGKMHQQTSCGRGCSAGVLSGSLPAVALCSQFVMHIASGVGPADGKVQKNSLPAYWECSGF